MYCGRFRHHLGWPGELREASFSNSTEFLENGACPVQILGRQRLLDRLRNKPRCRNDLNPYFLIISKLTADRFHGRSRTRFLDAPWKASTRKGSLRLEG